MLIQHKESPSKGVFFINDDEELVGELTYALSSNNQMIIEHTEIDEELRGGNLGYKLVLKAVEYARSHQYKIIPVCQFASAVLEKKPEFQDVWEMD